MLSHTHTLQAGTLKEEIAALKASLLDMENRLKDAAAATDTMREQRDRAKAAQGTGANEMEAEKQALLVRRCRLNTSG